MPNYINILSQAFPGKEWECFGDGTVYASFNWPDGNPILEVDLLNAELSIAQAQVSQAINNYRDSFLIGGWTFNGVVYDSDSASVQNIAGTMTMINSGQTLPSDFTWRAHDNSNVPFNNASFLGFFIAASTWREAAYRASWAHKANVAALTTIDQINGYNYTVGWIKGYTVSASGMTPVY